jgi:hypothetical protein
MVRQARHNNARDPGHACTSFSRFADGYSSTARTVTCHRNPGRLPRAA